MRTLRMAFVGGFAGALMASNMATLQAAPLPTNVAIMKSMVGDSAIQVRWRGGGWGHRGFGGWGYRGRGLGAGALAGAVIGGAIASSAYGSYGYYGGGPYYGGPYYGGYSYYPVDYSWEAIQEPGTASFYRPYGYGGRPWGYW